MTFQASKCVLGAIAISAILSSRALAVDPQTTGTYDSSFTSPVLSFPTTTVPTGRDRLTLPGSVYPGTTFPGTTFPGTPTSRSMRDSVSRY